MKIFLTLKSNSNEVCKATIIWAGNGGHDKSERKMEFRTLLCSSYILLNQDSVLLNRLRCLHLAFTCTKSCTN